jgi:cysteinyl-tRNA synthetase
MGHSILDAIGNTPLVEIKKLNPNPAVKLLAKLECFNPGSCSPNSSVLIPAAPSKTARPFT